MDFLGRVDIKLILAFDVVDVFFDFAEIRREGGPFLRGHDGPGVDAAGFEAACDDEGAGWVPFYDAEFFAGPFEDFDEGAVAAFPDVDVGVHEGGGGDEFAG